MARRHGTYMAFQYTIYILLFLYLLRLPPPILVSIQSIANGCVNAIYLQGSWVVEAMSSLPNPLQHTYVSVLPKSSKS